MSIGGGIRPALLRPRVLTALRWMTVSKLFGQLVSWTSTFFVIRLLSPGDYGLIAIAGASIGFFVLLNTAGLDVVLVQRQDLDTPLRQQVFGVVIVLNGLFFLGFLGAAPWIASYYHEAQLTSIIRILSFQFLLLIFETLPQAQLERHINFRRRSVVELVTILAGSLVTLTLAYRGFGVWTLVWGSMATTTIRMVGLNLIEPSWCWPRFSFAGMTRDLLFGRSATVDRVLRFILTDTDKFIGGKVFGEELLGYYAVANDLASLPLHRFAGIVNSIALPAFAHVQSDVAKARAYLLKAIRIISLLAFPLLLGVSSIAAELTALLLGPRWQRVAGLLQVLATVVPLRILLNIFQPLLWALGQPARSASTFLIGALAMPVAFLTGAYWGPVGLSVSWVVAYPFVFLLSVAHTRSLTGVRVADVLRTTAHPALASLLMYGAVLAARPHVVGMPGSRVLSLAGLVVVGVGTYGGGMWLLDRDAVQEAWEFVIDLVRA